MKFYGELEEVALEGLSSDPSNLYHRRIWYNTTDAQIKFRKDGTLTRALLLNDSKIIIGNSGTAANNVRIHRAGTTLLQFVNGGDTTVEDTPATTGIAKLSFCFESYTTANRPAAGNAGRTIWDTDLDTLLVDDGSAWSSLLSSLPIQRQTALNFKEMSGAGADIVDVIYCPDIGEFRLFAANAVYGLRPGQPIFQVAASIATGFSAVSAAYATTDAFENEYNRIVVVGNDSTTVEAHYSDDHGATWTQSSFSGASSRVARKVIWEGTGNWGFVVLVGESGTPSTDQVLRQSVDGTNFNGTWEISSTNSQDAVWRSICVAANTSTFSAQFLACASAAANNKLIAEEFAFFGEPDTWFTDNNISGPYSGEIFNDIIFCRGLSEFGSYLVAGGDTTASTIRKHDATNVRHQIDSSGTFALQATLPGILIKRLCYAEELGVVLAIGYNTSSALCSIHYSTDGETWQGVDVPANINFSGIAWSPDGGGFALAGAAVSGGPRVLKSQQSLVT